MAVRKNAQKWEKFSTQYTIIETVTMQLTMTSRMTAEGEKDSKVWDAAQPNKRPKQIHVGGC